MHISHSLVEPVDLVLETAELRCDNFEFVRVLEVVRAAVGRIETGQVEVAASLTWRFTIAFDLAPFTLIAIWVTPKKSV